MLLLLLELEKSVVLRKRFLCILLFLYFVDSLACLSFFFYLFSPFRDRVFIPEERLRDLLELYADPDALPAAPKLPAEKALLLRELVDASAASTWLKPIFLYIDEVLDRRQNKQYLRVAPPFFSSILYNLAKSTPPSALALNPPEAEELLRRIVGELKQDKLAPGEEDARLLRKQLPLLAPLLTSLAWRKSVILRRSCLPFLEKFADLLVKGEVFCINDVDPVLCCLFQRVLRFPWFE